MLNSFCQQCQNSPLSALCSSYVRAAKQAYKVNNGNIPKWDAALNKIKQYPKAELSYSPPYLQINLHEVDYQQLQQHLKQLVAWRKGPFKIGELAVDSEWDGSLKWNRVSAHIQPLTGKTVLDVGAGNGYFSFRMALAGAKLVLGIEPFLLFNYQFAAIRSLIKNPPNAFVLPLRFEQIDAYLKFDTIFYMGVLYHQKEPMQHLTRLRNNLADGGEVVLETLIIENQQGTILTPKNRYAKMRNVWQIPSIDTLRNWLAQAGFSKSKLVSINQTSTKEQRATPWIGENSASLQDFLDQNDHNLTIEGYPAPKRAIFICR